MPTIRDVAKLAGVSIGTASNVINNVDSVSVENVKKVKDAIQSLGYSPRSVARNLKSNQVNVVYIVVPDILNELYAMSYSYLTDLLAEASYTSLLRITHDSPSLETEILQKAAANHPAAIILSTCQPENAPLFQQIMEQGITLVFYHRNTEQRSTYVGFDNKRCVNAIAEYFIRQGCSRLALLCGPDRYSSERECAEGFREACADEGLPCQSGSLFHIDNYLASTYRTCTHILSRPDCPDVLIATTNAITDGLFRALQFSTSGRIPKIVAISDALWDPLISDFFLVNRPVFEACRQLVNVLLENISQMPFPDFKYIQLPYKEFQPDRHTDKPARKTTLRALALKGDISDGLSAFLPYIEKTLNLSVQLDSFDYEELYDAIYAHQDDDYYDVYFFDLVWLPDLAENGILMDISSHVEADYFSGISFHPSINSSFTEHGRKTYAMPFIYTTQLLFYRKDLFDDYQNSLSFRKMYQTNLVPPQTWTEFNAIARFFTRKYNPDSQTLYGTTLSGRYSSGIHVEYLTRLWSYQDRIVDPDGRPLLDSANAVSALENYLESYDYASPASVDNWWYEQVDEFISGQAAMMIMYTSHASPIVDRQKSSVLGKIGFAPVPGGSHTLGGWSVGINRNSKKDEAALSFIRMVCGNELALPLTLMGCFSANSIVFTSNVISDLYPWLSFGLEQMPKSRARLLPDKFQYLKYKEYEQILAKELRKCLTKECSPEEALKNANNNLLRFFRNSYDPAANQDH